MEVEMRIWDMVEIMCFVWIVGKENRSDCEKWVTT
jgi:hypothetical protein